MLNEVAAVRSQLTVYPPMALNLTEEYQKWCDANGLEMRQLVKGGSKSSMSNAHYYVLKPQKAAREVRRQERRAKRAKQRRKTQESAPEPVAEAQISTKEDTEDVTIERTSTEPEPEPKDQHDVVSEVEMVVAEEAPQVDEKPSHAEISEESTSDETGADELPEAVTTPPAASEQAASEITHTEGKQSSNKRSAATADLDDGQLPQDLQKSKKPKISVSDQEDEQDASRQVGSDAPPPPPAESITKITFAAYSQRHNLKAISPHIKQQREQAAKKKMEEDRKSEWESMTPEEQEKERQNSERLDDEAKSSSLTGDALKEHLAKMAVKRQELSRRAKRDAGRAVKGTKCVYDPELDKKLSAKDKLKGKPRFQQFEHRHDDNGAPSDPRLANPSSRRGTMGKGKARFRPEPYNLPVWSSDENDVVEMVEELTTSNIQQHTPEVVEKVEEQLAPVVRNASEQVAEKIQEQIIETEEAQAPSEVVEKAEVQSATAVVEEDEMQSVAGIAEENPAQSIADAASATAPPPVSTRGAAPAPSDFFSSLLQSIPSISSDNSNTQTSVNGTRQFFGETGITRANQPGKAPPMSSAIHAAYQSFD